MITTIKKGAKQASLKAEKMWRQFFQKVVVAIIVLPAFLLVLYAGGAWLFVPLLVITLIGLNEYYRAVQQRGYRPAVRLGFLISVLIMGATQFAPPELLEGTLLGLIIVLVGGALLLQLGNTAGESAVVNAAVTTFGVLYVPLMLSFLLRLREIDIPAALQIFGHAAFAHRAGAVLLVLAPIWLSDTVAMAVGGAWGRHKLAPRVSPGKTIEGAIAGFVTCVLGAACVGLWLGMPLQHWLTIGLLEAIIAPLGDLAKSALKRDLGIKDFGHLFGAHGGVLDRFDAIIFTMPVVYLYLWLFFGAPR